MPLTALNVSTSSRFAASVLPASNGTAADTVNFNSFANDGNTIVLAANTDGAVTRNVTVPVPVTTDSSTTSNKTYAIPFGVTWILGPYPVSIYGSTVEIRGDNAALKFNVVRPGQ
jgi:hypothetical protein